MASLSGEAMRSKIGRTCALIFLLACSSSTPAAADDIERQARALKLIRDTAADICNTIQQDGSTKDLELSGTAKAKVDGALSKIADLGIEGSANFKSDQFKGVLHQELATAIRDNANCRLEVLKLLNEKLLSTPARSGANLQPSGKIGDILKNTVGSCSLGHAVNSSGTKFIDLCLCISGYDETRNILNYQIKIKGRSNERQTRGDASWITYQYNSSATFNSQANMDAKQSRILVHAEVSVGARHTVGAPAISHANFIIHLLVQLRGCRCWQQFLVQ